MAVNMDEHGVFLTTTEASSNLYWAHLGLENSEAVRKEVSARVDKYLDFLLEAIRSLKQRSYKFSGEMETRLKLYASQRDYVEGDVKIFSDPEYRNQVHSMKGRESNEIVIPGTFKGKLLYVVGELRPLEILETRYFITKLKPIDIQEEEENDALDALFTSSDVNLSDDEKHGRVRILRPYRNSNEIEITEPRDILSSNISITVDYNTYTLSEQGKALETLIEKPRENFIPLLNLLRQSGTFEWESFETKHIGDFAVLTEESVAGTKEQRQFVEIALSTKDFAILEGPPGSGKTSTLMEIILKLCNSGKKVLMVASTHVAVDNILERIAESFGTSESLMDRFGVIPLRIGDIDRVSELVKGFAVDKRNEEEKKRLIQRLSGIKNPTEAQKTLLSALLSDRGKDTIERLVMDSANFVCGTTVGVLKSNIIRKGKTSGLRPFDYMILDEASKTTFADFIIPALYAERWIISGDVQQLAPYIEQDFIQAVLGKLPSFSGTTLERTEEIKQIPLDVFNAMRDNSYGGLRGAVVVSDDKEELVSHYMAQVESINRKLNETPNALFKEKAHKVAYSNLLDASDQRARLRILGSRIIFTTGEALTRSWKYVPPLLAQRGECPKEMKRRESAFLEDKDYSRETSTWEYEVTWRLNRAFEMREMKEKSKSYLDEIEFLLPFYLDRSGKRRLQGLSRGIMEDLFRVMNMFYPSIIELIQKGLNDRRFWNSEWETSLYEGIPRDYFEKRHVLLTYQHRMHPEISRWARELFYDSRALNDSPEVFTGRQWNYRRYNRRMIWKDLRQGKGYKQPRSNFNMEEVKVIKEELNNFLLWARENFKEKGGVWKVALLTFYRGQEKKLQDMMRSLTHLQNTRYFDLPKMNVEIEVCTVDRFQGQEADLVFLSMVRNRGVGFLDNRNRMNVAITRARYQMVIVGNKLPFLNSKVDFLKRLAGGMEGPIL
jgi:hypothetical protein